MDRKKVEAEKIDMDNLKILQKITSVSSTLPKKKLDRDWEQHKSYAQNIQRAKRQEMTDMFCRRREFLVKNFQGFPGIKNTQYTLEKNGSYTQRYPYRLDQNSILPTQES
eukprot:CAMPEP_0170548682 /NCGR_PEP_ID=MMETSP0211-20121228/6920_1 /TAXON_ID=311385 /ORGANISM="Pseudokeronopsis sp., Strain OXSARD2" /LENGTH=109 /DNA_ID=CAMNT_0010854303 /DNA_START=304 /DNA_END=633 /DNA_ORIENTATION=-